MNAKHDKHDDEFNAAFSAFVGALVKYEAHTLADEAGTKRDLQFVADHITNSARALSNVASSAQGRLNAAAFNRK